MVAEPIADLADAIAELRTVVDLAAASALSTGIPVAELWLEQCVDRIETRLVRGAEGPPPIGEISRGEVVARVWLEGLTLRYEGIPLDACARGQRVED